MTSVLSHRPPWFQLGLFFAAYVLGCGFAQSLAITPGTGISIWPPSGLFIATLILASKSSWPWWIVAGGFGELVSTVIWFHTPWPAAILIYGGNALEAVVGAWLISRYLERPTQLETLRDVLVFVVLGAGIAPIVSATIGGAALAWFGVLSQNFATAWPLWWIGDATGVLIVAPLALTLFHGWHLSDRFTAAQLAEAGVVGLIFLGVAALSLSGYLPFAYIIMPPLLWASVRFEFKGAAITLALLALITAIFTMSGASQFVGDAESQKHKQVMLHLFLAISAFSALIVAAISRQHQRALQTLRESVETLRDRERELSQLIDMVPVHIRRLTPEGKPTFFNKRLLDFFGLTDVGQLDKPDMTRLAAAIKTLVHPEDSDVLLDTVRRSFANGEPYSMKYRMRRADGCYRWVDGRAEPVRDEDGAITHWLVISIDIEDQTRAEEKLRQSEHRLQELVDTVPAMIWSMSRDGKPTYVNKRFTDVTGASLEDVRTPAGKPSLRLSHPDDVEAAAQAISNAIATEQPYILRHRQLRRDGSYRWTETRVEPLRGDSGDIAQWYGVSVDIHDLITSQEALRESEQKLQQLIDAVPAMIWTTTPEGKPTYLNKRYIDVTGATLEDFSEPRGTPAFPQNVIHPDDREMRARVRTEAFATGTAYFVHYRHIRRDGSYRWTETRAEPLRDDAGSIVAWYAVSVDIHDLVMAQEALKERERFLWQLVETLPAMIDCAAPNGEPVYRSQQLREFLGYQLEDLDGVAKTRLNATLEGGVHPDDVADVKENYARSLATGEPYARRHRLRRFDGEYRWVETRAAPMRAADGGIVQWNVICLDIEGEVRAQEALRFAQDGLARATQAASLAELSASIAHEVNQPLAAIVANSHACYRWLSAEPVNVDRAKTTAGRIIRDANSAAEVVSRIRALFRQSPKQRRSMALSGAIAEAHSLVVDEAARRRIRIDMDVATGLPLVEFDRVQIQQVLINLIRNGMEAMDLAADNRVLGVRVRRVGDEIQTEIRDHGHGIEFPERMFEPFFTTKDQGMGMGLAISRSIIESHGGRLWAENNEPGGATFIFTLPVTSKAAP